MYFLGGLLWLVASWFVARLITSMLIHWTKRAKNELLRGVLTLALLPVVFMAPLADEIVGKVQFDRLCEVAKEVKIYGTVPVGEELYTPDGKWRSRDTGDDAFKLEKFRQSLIYWDSGGPFPKEILAAITIYLSHTKIYERKTMRLLAEWDQYGTSGGWLSRNFQTPFLVRPQCMPEMVKQSKLQQHILPFKIRNGVRLG